VPLPGRGRLCFFSFKPRRENDPVGIRLSRSITTAKDLRELGVELIRADIGFCEGQVELLHGVHGRQNRRLAVLQQVRPDFTSLGLRQLGRRGAA